MFTIDQLIDIARASYVNIPHEVEQFLDILVEEEEEQKKEEEYYQNCN